eukprot:15465182-Alexandrium_andersonii.AAC.1
MQRESGLPSNGRGMVLQADPDARGPKGRPSTCACAWALVHLRCACYVVLKPMAAHTCIHMVEHKSAHLALVNASACRVQVEPFMRTWIRDARPPGDTRA